MPSHTAPPATVDLDRVRAAFPALAGPTVFLENAGGSQVPRVVAERMRDYMLSTYVQLGAPYALSQRATAVVDDAHRFVELLMNAGEAGRVILGPSTTALVSMIASCYRRRLEPGDEIIVAESGHEANVGPWARLADDGLVVKLWPLDAETWECPLRGLEPLLSPRTRIVALPHVSNLLGAIADVKAICDRVHEAGGRVVADGVAYAPHRAMDVSGWGVDWYVYSTYKVYGPHMAALFGTHDALAELSGPNHYFVADDDVPYKFEPGGVCHEGCAGLLALGEYLLDLAGAEPGTAVDRRVVRDAFEIMTACERPLVERLVEYLNAHPRFRIVGPAHAEDSRVGTISFLHESRSSKQIAEAAGARGIGLRNGHMYARRLCEALGLDPDDGVVRISLVHYNSPDDIERAIEVLDALA